MADVSTPLIEKKPFPEDRAIKLAMAREKALEVRRKNSLARKKAELERMENQMNPSIVTHIPESIPESIPDQDRSQERSFASDPLPTPEPEPDSSPEPPKVAPVKTKKQKRQMVVVEQSSDDSDEFQPNQSVVFVKRVRKKKEITPQPAAPTPPPATPQREPSPPKLPHLTSGRDRSTIDMYNSMFGGHFLSGGRHR